MFGRGLYIPVYFAGACSVAALASSALGQCPAPSCSAPNCNSTTGSVCCKPVGPDVIVGQIGEEPSFNNPVSNFNAEQLGGVWYDAFSFSTSSCNTGNANLAWYAFSNGNPALRNRHPAISQNLFRYKVVDGTGRFEQLGQSWLKHGFTALTQNACTCVCNGNGGTVLGIGCSDPYNAGRNAAQSSLGPKWQIDATSGYFPTSSPANPSFSGTTARRLRVRSSDLQAVGVNDPTKFFVEAMYVTQDDSAAGNKNNNASYRQITLTGGPNEYAVPTTLTTPVTRREQPGIMAWKEVDPSVTITQVVTNETPNPAAVNPACCTTGLVIVGAKATDLGGGIWHYEYAVQNVNSDRSVASFSVPLDGPIVVTNVGFRDVEYHSGDGIGNANRDSLDWDNAISPTAVAWETIPFAEYNNANALRWGTMYNFRFDANTPPTTGRVTLGMYKVVEELEANSIVPTPIKGVPCPADTNGDTNVNVTDLLAVINSWGACPGCAADTNGDGQVNVTDLLAVINGWGSCP